jgi:hypothetical protein
MSTNPRCQRRPKWPQFEPHSFTTKVQNELHISYLCTVSNHTPTVASESTYHFDSFLSLLLLLLLQGLIISRRSGKDRPKCRAGQINGGQRVFYVYMGNQRAKACSDWHFACGKRDDLMILLLFFILFHSKGLLPCLLWWTSACFLWVVSPTADLIHITSNSNVNQCLPLSHAPPTYFPCIILLVEPSTSYVQELYIGLTPQIGLRAMPNAI